LRHIARWRFRHIGEWPRHVGARHRHVAAAGAASAASACAASAAAAASTTCAATTSAAASTCAEIGAAIRFTRRGIAACDRADEKQQQASSHLRECDQPASNLQKKGAVREALERVIGYRH
jgi:hypothetical protein